MLFASSTIQLVLGLAVTVLPVAHGSIAIGNQIREGGTHYNVAWTEGVSPCTADTAIAPEKERLCNQNFSVDGNEYYLVGCTARNTGYAQNPKRLRRAKDNSLYGTCSPVSKKTINCKGSTHDVVKRYICG
ncbi:Fc.00g114470.m01.CDS01 [Cosmosporella sp. VM-42]